MAGPNAEIRLGREQGGAPPNQAEEHTVIIVAGGPKSGKSRALNNIFNVNFDSSSSAVTVTQQIKAKRVVKNGHSLIVVDTPGLGAADLSRSQVQRELDEVIGGLSYTVLYCHSVGPNSTDEDGVILKNLQKTLGKQVWQQCVFLFTFSDQLRKEHCPTNADKDKYIEILQSHTGKLSGILERDCKQYALRVRLVLDVDDYDDVGLEEIVAVPVGKEFKNVKERHRLIPRREMAEDWRDRSIIEILRKSTPMGQFQLLSLMHGKATVSTALTGGTLGALLGGIGGAVVGLIAGGVGAIPGAVVGSVVGGVGVGMGGAVMSRAVLKSQRNAQTAKMDRLKEAEFIEDDTPEGERPVEDADERPIRSPPIDIPAANPPEHQPVGETPSLPSFQPAMHRPVVRPYDPREEPDTID